MTVHEVLSERSMTVQRNVIAFNMTNNASFWKLLFLPLANVFVIGPSFKAFAHKKKIDAFLAYDIFVSHIWNMTLYGCDDANLRLFCIAHDIASPLPNCLPVTKIVWSKHTRATAKNLTA